VVTTSTLRTRNVIPPLSSSSIPRGFAFPLLLTSYPPESLDSNEFTISLPSEEDQTQCSTLVDVDEDIGLDNPDPDVLDDPENTDSQILEYFGEEVCCDGLKYFHNFNVTLFSLNNFKMQSVPGARCPHLSQLANHFLQNYPLRFLMTHFTSWTEFSIFFLKSILHSALLLMTFLKLSSSGIEMTKLKFELFLNVKALARTMPDELTHPH